MDTYYKLKALFKGNRSELARALKLTSPMVAQRWEKVGKIPAWRLAAVERLYNRKINAGV